MKFTAPSADLLRALAVAAGAVPSKSTLPILECVLFERDGDYLRLIATDLEIFIVQRLGVSFEGDGEVGPERVAIPARRLLDTLRALPNLPVTLSADDEQNVEVTTDQGRYKMVGHDGADYPAIPSQADARSVRASARAVKRAVEKTAFAVSKDSLRPAMMGVYFQVQAEETRIVATDGHRLVRLSTDALTSEEPLNFIAPEKALALVSRAAPEQDAECLIEVGNGFAAFDLGDTKVMGRMIDDPYPNYEAVIPNENDKRLHASRDALLAAVRRVALYSSSMTHQIRLSLAENELTISAEDIERASEARERVLCDYSGEAMEIGFNSVYLMEVLQNVDGDDVSLEFSTPNRAGVVTPASEPDGESMLMLIMPVMLNTYA
ncbi:DNA polymerase III subunit beta [soil metagenome]